MNDPLLIVLAGGLSSRMRWPGKTPLDHRTLKEAEEKSKSMIDVGGRPFLDYLLFNAESAGYREVLLVIGERDQSFRSYYGNADRENPFHRLQISYAVQHVDSGRTKPLGTADALLQGLKMMREWSGRAFTVCNSDNLYSIDSLRTMLESGKQSAMVAYDRAFLGQDPARVEQFAIVQMNPAGFLEKIIEKPSAEVVSQMLVRQGAVAVSMNLFRFEYDAILPFLERVPINPIRQEKELPAAVAMMVQHSPSAVRTFVAKEEVPDLTSRDDIHRVEAFLRNGYPNFSWP